ncbi:MAG: putative transposase [Candidatus Berkelbacteria bacterium Licking1014_7]|uniref:Putative transposase n=1 Tax=Candidatus Berkelbacteria bacterium Licking1014_7 TaxID=2017147 RepID=A0A554LJC4_9BACT|nr:MAG: putative transposase [Candidatus Berkelbacteria bacterium Licking1014_7]
MVNMATIRKNPLVTDEVYHIFSRSIADFKIFNNRAQYFRLQNALQFYQFANLPICFSRFVEAVKTLRHGYRERLLDLVSNKEKLVEIIAYCLMPTHIHLILKQLQDNGITRFMGNSLNSYSHYFNLKHRRRGPLWESEFKNVLVSSDEQLLHLTRYIHLNPVTAYLVENPKDWEFSSYKEYIGEVKNENKICRFDNILEIEPIKYMEFTLIQKDYQRELAEIKQLLIDNTF